MRDQTNSSPGLASGNGCCLTLRPAASLAQKHTMGKNNIQMQKGLSLDQFSSIYGTEEQCETAVEKSRWPVGYSCTKCGCDRPYIYHKKTLKVIQCSACRKQVTLTEDTIFHSTKLAAVQTNASNNPIYAVFHQVKSFCLDEVSSWAKKSLAKNTIIAAPKTERRPEWFLRFAEK